MPKGYVVAHIRIEDEGAYEEFKKMAGPAITQHGGRVLVRNGDGDHREGSLRGTVVVVEFDDLAAARRFYESEAYTAARQVRERAGETDLVIVEGVD
ncbi:hypothetical protein GCM10011316_14920 [Roseibium aquae]|uniref:DUF1330 domain-containing protein n=1 Tax=Roseibium aquae TaxID=1323746 RepID=A0A916WZ86_9HYPH|nr:DUF1330 domain-containing protein [Roseibium aquae]GGB43963.1 hypothetical protein GCM10011316_14920 [Roseibium aquae]